MADPPPPPQVKTSFMNSPLRKVDRTLYYLEILLLSGGINYTLVNFSENEGNSVTEGGEGWRRVERTPYYLEIFLQWRKIVEIVKIGK